MHTTSEPTPTHRQSPIVCGNSDDATRVGAALARSAHQPLIIVDAIGSLPVPVTAGTPAPLPDMFAGHVTIPGTLLPDREVEVEAHAVYASRVASLTQTARERDAMLIVLESSARRSMGLVRSLAVRLAMSATVPVLVIRESVSIRRWLEGKDVLRLMVAIDHSPSANAALEWAHTFAGELPVEVAAASLDPAVKSVGWRGAFSVIETAVQWHADVLVTACTSLRRGARFWRPSPPEILIDQSPINIAMVPGDG